MTFVKAFICTTAVFLINADISPCHRRRFTSAGHTDQYHPIRPEIPRGGGYPQDTSEVKLDDYSDIVLHLSDWKLEAYVPVNACDPYKRNLRFLCTTHPVERLIHLAPHKLAKQIAQCHGIPWRRNITKPAFPSLFESHTCTSCDKYVSVLAPRYRRKVLVRPTGQDDAKTLSTVEFPPASINEEHMETIISNFCREFEPERIVEEGCGVCGQLKPLNELDNIESITGYKCVLEVSGVTRKARISSEEMVEELKGPVLAANCDKVCKPCKRALRKRKIPHMALANGLWIGEVPLPLQDLTFIEHLMIARVRHNACYATVAAGGKKLKSNVVAFECDLPKVYSMLPPSRADLNSMIAVMFSGPTEPNESDLKCTPFLVRRRRVASALEWLTLNHPDYCDVAISKLNLDEYPESGIPVEVVYQYRETNRDAENIAVYDNDDAEGVESGPCPFVVHGLVDEPATRLTASELKAKAIEHWNKGGAALRMGKKAEPSQSFNNPAWWAQMFPWLFPYGLGSIGIASLSPALHKRFLMMYYDKRFQVDELFPLVAFNHEQLASASNAGFLTVEKTQFPSICDRLMSVNEEVLDALAKKLAAGETFSKVKKKDPEEEKCFQLLRDLDHVNGKVQGSLTSKKWMRNEVWSMINHHGAPLWYITLNPADKKHPLCLYWCSKKLEYKPHLDITDDERRRLIASNPVAGARFFHFMISNFIKHVLGVDSDTDGFFGKTKAYYGTVEQQGRLSLHLLSLTVVSSGLRVLLSHPRSFRQPPKNRL